MPVKTIRVRTSSISDAEIPEGKGATVRISFAGKRYRADLTEKEAREAIKTLCADEVKARAKKADPDDGEDANA